jgi:hypothetical protein
MNGFVGKYDEKDGAVYFTTHYHINVFANLEEGTVYVVGCIHSLIP